MHDDDRLQRRQLSTPETTPPLRWRARRSGIMTKALVVERDGVVASVPGRLGSHGREVVDSIFISAVEPIVRAGYPIVVLATFDAPLPGGLRRYMARLTMSRLVAVLRKNNVSLAAFACCPHPEGEGCACRKPRPGLLQLCADRFNVALQRSAYLASSVTDVETGARAGASTFVVDTSSEHSYHAAFLAALNHLETS